MPPEEIRIEASRARGICSETGGGSPQGSRQTTDGVGYQ